jgi:hypothetical protein
MKPVDPVEILLHWRQRGKVGGWGDEWTPGKIMKINRKTVTVYVEKHNWIYHVSKDRVREVTR